MRRILNSQSVHVIGQASQPPAPDVKSKKYQTYTLPVCNYVYILPQPVPKHLPIPMSGTGSTRAFDTSIT